MQDCDPLGAWMLESHCSFTGAAALAATLRACACMRAGIMIIIKRDRHDGGVCGPMSAPPTCTQALRAPATMRAGTLQPLALAAMMRVEDLAATCIFVQRATKSSGIKARRMMLGACKWGHPKTVMV